MLLLPDEVRAELACWARAGHPMETCGLLVGFTRDGDTHVCRAVQARNLAARARDHFDLDPGAHVAAERAAREQGLELVGVWHSHPDHPAIPSAADRVAAWENWSYLILSVGAAEVASVRSWRLSAGKFEEEELVTKSACVQR